MSFQEEILRTIPIGSENAISAETLWNQLGLSSRTGRVYIQKIRLDVNPILSDTNGYFMARPGQDGLCECKRYYHQMRKRAISSMLCAQAIKKYIQANDNQLSLFDQINDLDELNDNTL